MRHRSMDTRKFLELLSVEPDGTSWYWVTYGLWDKGKNRKDLQESIRIRVRVYVKRHTRRLQAIETEARIKVDRLIWSLLPPEK